MACSNDNTLAQRFWKKIDKNGPIPEQCPELGPCWIWTAFKDEVGRGQIATSKGLRHAHKVSWMLHGRTIPEGMCLLHRCDNTGCPNPDHLRLGTQLENIAEMVAKGRNPFGERHWTIRGARPRTRKPVPTLEERFWDKVNKYGPIPPACPELGNCWLWTGSTNQCGYGFFGIGGSGNKTVAHKVHWVIIAKCDMPSCVRLEHLFVGTHADNIQDMMAKGRNAQPRGEQHYKTKLNIDQVKEIRRLWSEGVPQTELALRFSRKPNTISKIVNRKRWL